MSTAATSTSTITVRPLTLDDLPMALRLLAADEERSTGRPSRLGEADVRQWWSAVQLATDSWLLVDKGDPVGIGWIECIDDVAESVVCVDPGAHGRDLETTLLGLTEQRARESGAARIHQMVLSGDEELQETVRKRGYEEVRRFWDMAIEMDSPPDVPAIPDGFTLDRVREEELPAFHAAADEAFQDHWEHHPLTFDEWWQRRSADPDLDLSLWFAVRDGAEFAGVIRNENNRNGGGYVANLSVRRAWRGKGLARVLLLTTFREFYARGIRRVTLGVDSQNPTGATRLYQGVGMTVELEMVVFEKPLEPAA